MMQPEHLLWLTLGICVGGVASKAGQHNAEPPSIAAKADAGYSLFSSPTYYRAGWIQTRVESDGRELAVRYPDGGVHLAENLTPLERDFVDAALACGRLDEAREKLNAARDWGR